MEKKADMKKHRLFLIMYTMNFKCDNIILNINQETIKYVQQENQFLEKSVKLFLFSIFVYMYSILQRKRLNMKERIFCEIRSYSSNVYI